MKYKLYAHPHQDGLLIKHLERTTKNAFDILDNKNLDYEKVGISEQIFKNILQIITYCHDFGKGSLFFQQKLNYPENFRDSLSNEQKEILQKYTSSLNILSRHGLISALFGYFVADKFLSNINELNEISKNKLKYFVFLSIKRHHGNLGENEFGVYNSDEDNVDQCLFILKEGIKNYSKGELSDIYVNLLELKYPVLDDFCDFLCNYEDGNFVALKRKYRKTLDFKDYFIFNLLYSCLLEADKKDAIFVGGEEEKNFFERNINYNLILRYKNEKFKYDNEFNQVREQIYKDVLFNLEKELKNGLKNRIFSISTPTGSGKTLMMLGCGLKLKEYFKNQGINSRIIYSLPFLSIIEQNVKVVKEILKKKFDREIVNRGGDIFLESHSLAESVFVKSDQKQKDELSYDEANFLVDNWYSQIIVTTFHQLFYSILTNKNRFLKRYNKLLNSIILIDEIQAIPPRLITPIAIVFKYLTEVLNCTIIIGTATKPTFNHHNDSEDVKIKVKELSKK